MQRIRFRWWAAENPAGKHTALVQNVPCPVGVHQALHASTRIAAFVGREESADELPGPVDFEQGQKIIGDRLAFKRAMAALAFGLIEERLGRAVGPLQEAYKGRLLSFRRRITSGTRR